MKTSFNNRQYSINTINLRIYERFTMRESQLACSSNCGNVHEDTVFKLEWADTFFCWVRNVTAL